ncbi:PREDICTED: uncharacterized protein LOC106148571 [Chinchilla lanigera]|uniref:uncharacterized protein LOC106148571 n=1 Tax=Chinchilla lanigera TaxID=34839 RepID=UPI0006969A06|nr:PREDICTED: uncharacterized protein LOC106148571 [Chinchilla lanigera]
MGAAFKDTSLTQCPREAGGPRTALRAPVAFIPTVLQTAEDQLAGGSEPLGPQGCSGQPKSSVEARGHREGKDVTGRQHAVGPPPTFRAQARLIALCGLQPRGSLVTPHSLHPELSPLHSKRILESSSLALPDSPDPLHPWPPSSPNLPLLLCHPSLALIWLRHLFRWPLLSRVFQAGPSHYTRASAGNQTPGGQRGQALPAALWPTSPALCSQTSPVLTERPQVTTRVPCCAAPRGGPDLSAAVDLLERIFPHSPDFSIQLARGLSTRLYSGDLKPGMVCGSGYPAVPTLRRPVGANKYNRPVT